MFTGDAISYNNEQQFSTKDRDNDKRSSGSCVELHHGAFWFRDCAHANLNGEYFRNGTGNVRGVNWNEWKHAYYSMKRVEMKIKPK